VACRFGNYLLLLQHVEAARSVALLPALAVPPSHAVVTRELTTARALRGRPCAGILAGMVIAHTAQHLLTLSAQLEAAGVMRTIGHAIFGFLAVVFVVGGLIGFFIGRATGRRS
jgi:hypothetical protein